MLSAPQLLWKNAGRPPHKYEEEPYGGPCATCGADTEHGVPTEEVNNPTFSNHADFFRYGTHVCRACAWLYGDPKRAHRNVIALGGKILWPMISLDSATEERPSWREVFRRILPGCPPDSFVCGVMTTDPKPRNWPHMRLSSAARPALYVHAPDYDTSCVIEIDPEALLSCMGAIEEALSLGFPKSRIYAGLLSDYARAKRNIKEVMRLEKALREIRKEEEFVPALLAAGLTKEEKERAKSGRADRGSREGRAARGFVREDPSRLF